MPSGTVEKFSDRDGMFCVRVHGDSSNGFAVFHLMAPTEPKVGDVVAWTDSEPRTVLKNKSQGDAIIHVDRALYALTKAVAYRLVS